MVSQRLSTTYAAVATTWPALTRVIEKLTWGPRLPSSRSGSLLRRARQHADDEHRAGHGSRPGGRDRQRRRRRPDRRCARDLGRDSEFQQSIDDDLQETQDQIKATQDRVDALAALVRPEPEDLATLESLQGRLASLRSTYASLLAYSTGSANNLLSIVEPALAPDAPVQPRTLLNTLLGTLVALFLALGLAAILEYLDDRVKNADTIQESPA